MTTPGQIKAIQKRVSGLALDSNIHFFDGTEEYEKALKSGEINVNDVCIIDDISNDESNVRI